MFWPVSIFVSSIIVSYKQAQSPFSVAEHCFSHHLGGSAHSSEHAAKQQKACVYQASLWALGLFPNTVPPHIARIHKFSAGTCKKKNTQESPYCGWSSLHIQPQCLSATVFFWDCCCVGMKCGLSSKYNIRKGGGTVWCKNLMKAANLCEWLRGIMLVRRRKKQAGDALSSFFLFLEVAMNLCKQWK